MGLGTRTAEVIGSSTRSLDEAVRDGMARAARLGALWARITRISARTSADEHEVYRVSLLIGLRLAQPTTPPPFTPSSPVARC
ncbi:dodecin domain-containing protein [Pseudonocardia lacus]|uniref:dodecin domain-containing protein n=1 Tax=Pseudonocardia lacus TaxID=2835865 RepID=UPI001BDD2909|nr:dodecin domain-containing protein [Pseudonocardia lacus]